MSAPLLVHKTLSASFTAAMAVRDELVKTQSAQALRIREASVEDHGQITALQLRNGMEVRTFEDWVELWRNNPVCQCQAEVPIGWVLESGGEVVGWIGNIPLAYHFRGHDLRAATAYSWVVDGRYRAYSIPLLGRFLRQKNIDLLVFNTVSSSAEPLYRSLGLSKMPAGSWNQSAFWITNYRDFSRSVLKRQSIPLAPAFRYLVSGALFCRDAFEMSWRGGHRSASSVELCSAFDSRFDEFWEELKRQNDNTLLAVRTQETLQWHFRGALLRGEAWILTASQGSRLVAYAIFDRQDNVPLALKRVRLVDFQALHGAEEALRPALCWMLDKCRQDKIGVLEVIGSWADRPNLPQIPGSYRRTLPSWMYYYKAAEKQLSETLKDPGVWAPSSFEGDASL
jgi:hypothetical protein